MDSSHFVMELQNVKQIFMNVLKAQAYQGLGQCSEGFMIAGHNSAVLKWSLAVTL